jgi:hypothetical protein
MLFFLHNTLLAVIPVAIMDVEVDTPRTPSLTCPRTVLPPTLALPTLDPTAVAQAPAAPVAFQTRNTTAKLVHP